MTGSISYFPLTDGTAIVTKQLQQDGSSKTTIYKRIDEKELTAIPDYITSKDLEDAIKKIDTNSIKEEIKMLKRQMKDVSRDVEDLRKD